MAASQFWAAAVSAVITCKEPNLVCVCVCVWFCVWLWAVRINGAGKRTVLGSSRILPVGAEGGNEMFCFNSTQSTRVFNHITTISRGFLFSPLLLLGLLARFCSAEGSFSPLKARRSSVLKAGVCLGGGE